MSDYYTTQRLNKNSYLAVKEWCGNMFGESLQLADGVDTTGTKWIYSDDLRIILLATDKQRMLYDLKWG